MKVIKTMLPGDQGTQRLERIWGNKLVSVRYRETDHQILTTIEIIVDEREKLPNISRHKLFAEQDKTIVAVKVAYQEEALRAKIKAAGGRWSKQLKLWLVPYGTAVRLAIKDRIQPGEAEKCLDVDTSLISSSV